MKITAIDYAQVKSIGTNETCRAAVKVVLEDGESADKAFEVAKACVRRQLGMNEKQKEEDKEKNRQREAMKTKITDGPVYGYPTTQGHLTQPEYIETRRRPTQEIDVTNQETAGGTAIRAGANRPREIVFRATREGVNAEPNREIRAIPTTEAELRLTPDQQRIMDQHVRNMANEIDRRFIGTITEGTANQAGTEVTVGVVGVLQDIAWNAGAARQGAETIAAAITADIEARRIINENNPPL